MTIRREQVREAAARHLRRRKHALLWRPILVTKSQLDQLEKRGYLDPNRRGERLDAASPACQFRHWRRVLAMNGPMRLPDHRCPSAVRDGENATPISSTLVAWRLGTPAPALRLGKSGRDRPRSSGLSITRRESGTTRWSTLSGLRQGIRKEDFDRVALVGAVAASAGLEITALFKLIELAFRY
jgi:hypothetical protein